MLLSNFSYTTVGSSSVYASETRVLDACIYIRNRERRKQESGRKGERHSAYMYIIHIYKKSIYISQGLQRQENWKTKTRISPSNLGPMVYVETSILKCFLFQCVQRSKHVCDIFYMTRCSLSVGGATETWGGLFSLIRLSRRI